MWWCISTSGYWPLLLKWKNDMFFGKYRNGPIWIGVDSWSDPYGFDWSKTSPSSKLLYPFLMPAFLGALHTSNAYDNFQQRRRASSSCEQWLMGHFRLFGEQQSCSQATPKRRGACCVWNSCKRLVSYRLATCALWQWIPHVCSQSTAELLTWHARQYEISRPLALPGKTVIEIYRVMYIQQWKATVLHLCSTIASFSGQFLLLYLPLSCFNSFHKAAVGSWHMCYMD